MFKIRLYSIVIYFIFKGLIKKFKDIKNKKLIIQVCLDFSGHENDIKENLSHFLKSLLGLDIDKFLSIKVPKEENADKYAFLVSRDTKNKFKEIRVNIKLKDFEKFLKKK